MHVVHLVGRDSHPWGEELSVCLFLTDVEHFGDGILLVEVHLDEGECSRLMPIRGHHNSELFVVSGNRLEVSPVENNP